MRIRRLGSDEWELLRDVRLAALLDAPTAFGSRYADQKDDDGARWKARLDGRTWFVAEFDGAPGAAGIAATMPSEGLPRGRWDLTSVWVHPARRGLGAAAALLGAAREHALAAGATELALWVTDGNEAALSVYRGAGFVPTGQRQPLPGRAELGETEWVLTLAPVG